MCPCTVTCLVYVAATGDCAAVRWHVWFVLQKLEIVPLYGDMPCFCCSNWRLCHCTVTCRWPPSSTSRRAATLTRPSGLHVSPAAWAHSPTFSLTWTPSARTTWPTLASSLVTATRYAHTSCSYQILLLIMLVLPWNLIHKNEKYLSSVIILFLY